MAMPIKSNCRAVFVNEASASIGMGHILRSLVLARIMYLRGYDIFGVTVGDEKAVLFANERATKEQIKYPTRTAIDSKAAINGILIASPSVLVVDCSKAAQEIVQVCAGSGITIVALDYFISEKPLPAAIINLIDHNPATLAGNPPLRAGTAYYEGPQYAIVRDEFMEARRQRTDRGERTSIKNILIAFGGADPSGNTRRALELVARWPGEFVVDLIVGPLFAMDIERIAEILRDKCLVRTHFSPRNMGQLFADADLVFCGGGGTLLEVICVGTPAIVIAQNDAELRHAASLAKRGACWLSNQAEWGLVSAIENRTECARSAKACVDGLGAERICDAIELQIK